MEATQTPAAEHPLGEYGFMVFKAITRFIAIVTSFITFVSASFMLIWLIGITASNWAYYYFPPELTVQYIIVLFIIPCLFMYSSGIFIYHDCEDTRMLLQQQKWQLIAFNVFFMVVLYQLYFDQHVFQLLSTLSK